MSYNNLSKAMDKGLINPNQILQSMVRGTDPIKAFGETEMRVSPLYLQSLEKTTDADFDGGYISHQRHVQAVKALASGVESSHPKLFRQRNTSNRALDMFHGVVAPLPLLVVEHNWLAALDKFVGEMQDELIVLPFPECRFVLKYAEHVRVGYAAQDPHTLAITVSAVTNAEGKLVDELSEVFKRHVAAVCVALEMELAGQTGYIVKDLGKSSVSSGVYKEEYKILPITKKGKAGSHNINTGKTKQRLHVKRSHWRTIKGVRTRIKWFFAGDIELGIIVKDYAIE